MLRREVAMIDRPTHNEPDDPGWASRGALKLDAALTRFGIDPAGRVCADLGCSTGGFTDVLLRRGAARVHAVDTGYGVLAWRLRSDPRVVVHERMNALYAELPERCGLVVVDVGWTRQERIIPRALALLGPDGEVVSLLKPHYEAPPDRLEGGLLPPSRVDEVVAAVLEGLGRLTPACRVVATMPSPVPGGKGGNAEVLLHLRPAGADGR
ncbi:MAG: SAM-dependent methyltransferase [Candidatus Krumholzibacteriia bacterium]